jgi:hypothetical protein
MRMTFMTTTTDPTLLDLGEVDVKMIVSTNKHLHYMDRQRLTQFWRPLARDAALDAYGDADPGESWHQRARIVVTFRFPGRTRRDVGNLYQYVAKPIVDGLIDAHVLPDDDDLHLVGPDLRRNLEPGPCSVTVTIEDLS